MDDFYAARSRLIPPLPWPTVAPPFSCGNCEDFDAMQPYRVPLDALMEIDDRRAA
ncbi:hypothetical protein P775_13505 [Puniceibacterium antarcticum]|uniref:Uncharacterized protein n=1 Tax=Puniceibacterium antarcticum TaxID=1206336 RepID=A0A2G8RDS6_9RHOB|nr:hypothetical protein P775_13505 [Puniceibacterium antarcticum]